MFFSFLLLDFAAFATRKKKKIKNSGVEWRMLSNSENQIVLILACLNLCIVTE